MTQGNGYVMTIDGPVDPGELGITLIHEHLFLDMRPAYARPPQNAEEAAIAERPLTMDLFWREKRNLGLVRDAIVLDDEEMQYEEVMEFRKLGGQTIVDVTPRGIHVEKPGFRPRALQELSRRTGIKIVLGCGWYVKPAHPAEVAAKSVDELTEELLRELSEGVGGSGVRPGVIGEIGISQPVDPDEWKSLTAACQAQVETGLPLYIHPYFGTRSRVSPEIVRFCVRQGVDPERINMNHMDGYMNLDYQRRVLDMGVWISFDTFGLEQYYDALDFNHNCHDSQREEHLIALLELGYQDQILLSQDVCTKIQTIRYGGHGYGHLLRNILPSLRFEGVQQHVLDQLLIENPKRLLTVSPRAGRAAGEAAVAGAAAP